MVTSLRLTRTIFSRIGMMITRPGPLVLVKRPRKKTTALSYSRVILIAEDRNMITAMIPANIR